MPKEIGNHRTFVPVSSVSQEGCYYPMLITVTHQTRREFSAHDTYVSISA